MENQREAAERRSTGDSEERKMMVESRDMGREERERGEIAERGEGKEGEEGEDKDER